MQDLTTKLEKYERVLQRALGSRWDTDIDAYLDGQIEVPELDKLRKERELSDERCQAALKDLQEAEKVAKEFDAYIATMRKELAMMKGRLEFATDNAVELANQRDSAKQEVVELRAQVQQMMKNPQCTLAERDLLDAMFGGKISVAKSFDVVAAERREKRNFST